MDTESFVKFMHDIDDGKKCFLMDVYAIYKGCKDITVPKDVSNIAEVGKYIKKWDSCSVDSFIDSLHTASKSAAFIIHQVLNGADQATFGISEDLFDLLNDVTRNNRFVSIASYLEDEFGYEDITYGCDNYKNSVRDTLKGKSCNTEQQTRIIKRLVAAAKKELLIFTAQFNEVMETSLFPRMDSEGIQGFKDGCSTLYELLDNLPNDFKRELNLNDYAIRLAEYGNSIKNARYDWQLGNIGKNLLDRLFMLISAIGCEDISVLAEIDMRRAAYGTAEWDKEVKG